LLRAGARLAFTATHPIRAGDSIAVGGRVVDGDAAEARCELWVHNHEGQLCGVGRATLMLEGQGGPATPGPRSK